MFAYPQLRILSVTTFTQFSHPKNAMLCRHSYLPLSEISSDFPLGHQSRGVKRRSFLTRSASLAVLGLMGAVDELQAVTPQEVTQPNPTQTRATVQGQEAFRFRVTLAVKGNLHLPKNPIVSKDLAIQLPIQSEASFDFVEHAATSSNASDRSPAVFVRYYEKASAKTKIHTAENLLELPELPNGVVAILDQNRELIFANDQKLSREELDLLRLPISSSQLDALLPQDFGRLEPGEAYALDSAALASAFQLTAVNSSQVKGEIKTRDVDLTKLQFQGELRGQAKQTGTEIEMIGKLNFDSRLKTCTWLAIGLREKREISLTEPGFELAATLKIQKVRVQTDRWTTTNFPQNLDEIPTEKLELTQRSSHLQFELETNRNWYMVTDAPGITTLRLIVRDQAIAQCDFRAPPTLPEGQKYAIEDFQAEIAQRLGEQLTEIEEINIQSAGDEVEFFRVVANGSAQGIPIRWVCLHFSSASGRRLTATFTMESGMVAQFLDSDTKIAASLRFTARNTDDSAPSGLQKPQKTEAG